MWFLGEEYWNGLPFPSPVDHVLSEFSTMTCQSWVALHGMAHSFIELDKAVVHMIILISFPLLWFSFCLPSDGQEAYEEAELNWKQCPVVDVTGDESKVGCCKEQYCIEPYFRNQWTKMDWNGQI